MQEMQMYKEPVLPEPLKTGISRSTRSLALSKNMGSSDKSKALSSPPTMRMVVSNKESLAFWLKFRFLSTQVLALQSEAAL